MQSLLKLPRQARLFDNVSMLLVDDTTRRFVTDYHMVHTNKWLSSKIGAVPFVIAPKQRRVECAGHHAIWPLITITALEKSAHCYAATVMLALARLEIMPHT